MTDDSCKQHKREILKRLLGKNVNKTRKREVARKQILSRKGIRYCDPLSMERSKRIPIPRLEPSASDALCRSPPEGSLGRATYVLIRSVKTNKALLLTEVTRPRRCRRDPLARAKTKTILRKEK